MKKSWIALALSFFLPGIGHIYIGNKKKGFLLILLFCVSYGLCSYTSIAAIFVLGIEIYSIINCQRTLKKERKQCND